MNTINNVLWAQKFGGTSNDAPTGIVVDSSGNTYVTGYFGSSATFGNTTLTSGGLSSAFITKLDSSGKFLWTQKFGQDGGLFDPSTDITVDASGNTYITGNFSGTATFGNITLKSAVNQFSFNSSDAFITKLDSSGNFLWAQKLGGTSDDAAKGITVDASGNTYVTGTFSNTATFGSTTLTSAGSSDAFITKLDNSGNVLWTKKLGGTSLDNGYDIAADGAGNTYVKGSFNGPATFGNTTLTSTGDPISGNPFITKLDSSGNFLWAQKFDTGFSYNPGGKITVDSLGNTYITGTFNGTATFSNITLNSTNNSNDAFITKLDSSGKFLWAQKLGGASSDSGNDITVDSSGNIYVTGRFADTGTFGNITLTADFLSSDAFVAKLDSNGNVLSAKKLGGTSNDAGNGIAIDGTGNTYVTGTFDSTAIFGNTTFTNAGNADGFIVKLGQQDITLALTPSSVVEDGSNNLIYTFTREGNTTNPVTVNFNVGGNATFNTDYTAVGADTFTATNGTVTFAAGATTATVTIDPTADTTFEPDETVALTLAAGGGYSIVTSAAVTGNITNDDTQVTLAVTPSNVVEDGSDKLTYTFTRQGKTTDPLTVNFNVGGNASVETDYTQTGAASFSATNGTVTFAAGATTATVTIDPTTDTTVESDETVGLTLVEGTGYSIGTSGAVTGNITNDDTQISLAVTRSISTSGSNVVWAQKFGGTFGDAGWSIAADGAGNTYATGAFTNTANFGNTTLTSTGFGDGDAFVAKFDSSGKVLWAQKLGGTLTDYGFGITVDGAGNSYATGNFSGTATFGSTTLTSAGNEDAFITKLDSSGKVLWAQKLGGTSSDSGYSIATDGAGNTYVTGVRNATSVTGSVNASVNSTTNDDAFITKVDNNGNILWTKNLGGAFLSDRGTGITSDGTGNTYVTGFFSGTTTFGNTTLTSAGNQDAFITKLDSSGNFLWAKKFGGTLADLGVGITSDGVGNTYVTGIFRNTATFGSTTLTSGGDEDAFVAKLDGNGNVVWAKNFGGIGIDEGIGIVTDGLGNIYVTGAFSGTVSFGSTTLTSAGNSNAFIAKLDSDGNILSAQKLGSTSIDIGFGITSDGKGNIYATGAFADTGSFGNTSLISAGSIDGFVVKLAEPQISLPLTPNSVVEDGNNNLIYTFTRQGQTTDPLTVNFNVGGDATLNTDYTAAGTDTFTATNGTVTFAAGSTIATVTIDPTADTIFEPDETVGLTLAAGTGYNIGTSEAVTGNITNDDTQITLALAANSVAEDGNDNLIYTFTRQGKTTDPLTVNFNVGGNATFNTDYTALGANTFTATNGTVTFAAGATTATVTIDPTPDTTVESDETVGLTLAAGTGYSIGTSGAVTGNINPSC